MPVHDYAELNTNLSTNTATAVPALNGRQGDNNREVFFWLKDGKANFDLTGKTVTLFAKDASGVVKTASTINDQSGLSMGRFSLIIPSAFYQATGAAEDAYIQVANGDTIVSTIPVAFQVIENTMVVTQTQSQVFLSTVDELVKESNDKIATLGTNLAALENAQKSLQITLDNLNTQFNSDLFAQKAKDNEFKGNNTFDGTATFQQKIVAPNGLQGKADSAGQADNATNAVNATNATNANHASVADTLTTTNSQTVQDLTVNGQFVTNPNQKITETTWTDSNGLSVHVRRINNVVMAVFYGSPAATQPNNWMTTVPAGYRPVDACWFYCESVWDRGITLCVQSNGKVGVASLGSSDGNKHGVQGTTTWITEDAMPS